MNYKSKKFMSTQKSQSHKRQEQNNTEWLDELINKIESMLSILLLNSSNQSVLFCSCLLWL